MYLKTGSENFTGSGAVNFRNRLEAMSMLQDNYSIYAIKDTEELQQFTTSLAGMAENCEFFYQIIAAKTDITLSILLAKGASGLSGTLEGERKNFYDRIRRIQSDVKPNLLKMCGIVAGKISDGKFVEFEDYVFNPLETASERELAENIRSYTEVARSLLEMGVKPEDALNWLKGFKDFHLDQVEYDAETEGLEGYDDFNDDMGEVEAFNENPNHDEKGRFTSGSGESSQSKGSDSNKYIKELAEILDKAHNNPSQTQIVEVGDVSENLKKEASSKGFNLDGYKHNLDVSGIRHAFLEHGDEKKEEKRGQEAITDKDLKYIPQIVSDYDTVEFPGKNKIGRDVIRYSKQINDGTIFYLEEIRTGKKTLTIQTMYKHKGKRP